MKKTHIKILGASVTAVLVTTAIILIWIGLNPPRVVEDFETYPLGTFGNSSRWTITTAQDSCRFQIVQDGSKRLESRTR